MKNLLILIFSIITLIGCSKNDENKTSDLRIRLANVSQFDFTDITVNTSTGPVNFDDINSGQKTDYKQFEIAYRYAFIELDINGNTYTLQSIDYVGETTLENGNYTYQINANISQEQDGKLSLTLVEN